MHRTLLVFLASLLFCTLGAAADSPILPNQFGPWQAEGPSKMLQVKDLDPVWSNWPNGEYVLKEAGLQRIESYTFRNGSDEITVHLYVLRDPSSAYEFYTFLLAPGMKDLGLGKDSAGETDVPVLPNARPGMYVYLGQHRPFIANARKTQVLIGNMVLQAAVPSNVNPDSLKELVNGLQAKVDDAPLPPLKSYLPEHWKIFGSEKYALGPAAFQAAINSLGQNAAAGLVKHAGFENGAEAILAAYRGEHGSGTLLLLEYPTPQLAEQHLHHLEQALPAELKKAGVTVERKASLLSLVFSPTSPEHARAIRDEVQYDTEVTWNEPSHTATDPPMVLIMYKILIFTGLFLGIATAVGVAFGGVRVIIKRMFPGKVFDRPENIEVLQLGLSGKKIDPTDMY